MDDNQNNSNIPPVPPNQENTNSNNTPPADKQVEISINLKEPPKEKIMLNFGKGMNTDDFLSKKTESQTNQEKIASSNPTPEVKNIVTTNLQTLGQPSSNQYTEAVDPAYFQDIAEGITWVIDLVATWALAKFALDPNVNSTPYKIQKEKIDRLKVVMGKILAQMKYKFPLGWLFFAMLVACYAGSFTLALGTRQKNLKIREEEAKKKKELEKQKKAGETNPNLQQKVAKQMDKGNVQNVPFTETKVPIVKQQQQSAVVITPREEEIPPVVTTKKTVKINPSDAIKNLKGNDKSKLTVVPVITSKTKVPKIKGRGGSSKN